MSNRTPYDGYRRADVNENKGDGFFVKPLSGSFRRVKEKLADELTNKTPTQAMRDDLGGSVEPSDEEITYLESRVGQVRDDRRAS